MADKRRCEECHQEYPLSRVRAYCRLAAGTVLYVCLKCWRSMDYGTYMRVEKRGERCNQER